MYKVYHSNDEKYGNVIIILHSEDNGLDNPFLAIQEAFRQKRIWSSKDLISKIRILVNGQIMTHSKAECWAREEYKSLPKCAWCVKILTAEIYTHQLRGDRLFCSQDHADKDYHEEMEHLKDEEEIEP